MNQTTDTKPSGARLWIFRLAALILVPAAALLAVELVLRLVGFGFPASFFVDVPEETDVLTTNQRFGWRFFPPELARAPVPTKLAEEKGDAVRIFVVGGSAARGTPEPGFSLARQLQAMLEATYPDGRFEVENAAMTAINSHVVLPIVRDIAEEEPDLVIVYLGNNEVVGPYGAGTIFSPFEPRLGMIRGAIGAKSLRLGQLVDGLVSPDDHAGEWRGMEMFLEHRIAADDPRLAQVYGHFEQNLTDIVAAARDGGAEVILSTVAVNLRDQPPFASLESPDLSPADAEHFAELLESGRLALADDPRAALYDFERCLLLDPGHAGAHYLRGRAFLALGQTDAAIEILKRARDLDALRFRADSTINRTIYAVANASGASLVDAEKALLEGGGLTDSLPGRTLFYEHVHLSFAGNYALARTIFDEVRDRLPERVGAAASEEAPTLEEIAERVVFTPYDALAMEREMLQLVSRPPFTSLLGHAVDLRDRRRRLRELRASLTPADWQRAEGLYQARIEEHPDDLLTRRRFAEILQARGEVERAADTWSGLLERLGTVGHWHSARAVALADAGRPEEALKVIDRAIDRFPENTAKLLVNKGSVLEQVGRFDEAAEVYREAWEEEPSLPEGLYNLATLTARRGELEAAVELYRQLVERHPEYARGHHNLAVTLERLGDLEGAEESYRAEIEAAPGTASGQTSLGVVLEKLGRHDEAFEAYVRAVQTEPDHPPALFNLADFLLSRGRPREAVAYYTQGLALVPSNLQARQNRAKAFFTLGQAADAIAELERLLEVGPDEPTFLLDLAGMLATADEANRDLERSVELAERAAELTERRSPSVLFTLGSIYDLVGQKAAAIATLQEGLELARELGDEAQVAAFEKRIGRKD